jgi:adenosylcobinamide kinase/adenosylcobinamide-phosphate guanylyltransferase
MGRITLILGGARSGKSRFAQNLASRLSAGSGGRVTYLATATVKDEEMRLRVSRHRANRPAEWRTVEEPRHVARTLSGDHSEVVIVDCLTLLITNVLLEEGADRSDRRLEPEDLERVVMLEIEELLQHCRRIPAEVLLVSNEVGLSVVPPTPLGRVFRDIAGRVNQRVAGEAEEVFFLLAGLVQKLKGEG